MSAVDLLARVVRAGDRVSWPVSEGARRSVEAVLLETPELRTPALDALLRSDRLATAPAAPAQPHHVPVAPSPLAASVPPPEPNP